MLTATLLGRLRGRFTDLSRAGVSAALIAASVIVPSVASAQTVVTTSTFPGPVEGARGGSDEVIWNLMITQIAVPATPGQPTPAAFETWASDADVFNTSPHFPTLNEPHEFQASLLGKTVNASSNGVGASPPNQCGTTNFPGNPFIGGFPSAQTPANCIAEEVKRNRPEYDYIVNNKLYTKALLATAYSNNFQVNMPASAISVKGDWVPVATLIAWVPRLGNQATVENDYLTATVNGVEFALVSLHVASKQNPAWVWGTFEHQYNPGRCDYLGCYDRFGAVDKVVRPDRRNYNTQYGECRKTPALRNMMKQAGLSPVWLNYCLKGSMVDSTPYGQIPASLGNSVIEGINAGISVIAASCITCHAYAAFGSNGSGSPAAFAMLNQNPTGKVVPGVLNGSRTYDFMWGFLGAP